MVSRLKNIYMWIRVETKVSEVESNLLWWEVLHPASYMMGELSQVSRSQFLARSWKDDIVNILPSHYHNHHAYNDQTMHHLCHILSLQRPHEGKDHWSTRPCVCCLLCGSPSFPQTARFPTNQFTSDPQTLTSFNVSPFNATFPRASVQNTGKAPSCPSSSSSSAAATAPHHNHDHPNHNQLQC